MATENAADPFCHHPHVVRRILLPIAATAALLAAPAVAAGASPGANSLGDPIFPQIGNGGYDVADYDLAFSYDPVANRLGAGTRATITATATQSLSRFSLDFQRDLAISSVTIDGRPAHYGRRDAKPRLSRNRKVSQPAKLYVTPDAPIRKGTEFVVTVAYSGVPAPIVDTDLTQEGWVHACNGEGTCDGSFTVNEPIGSQSWFPCNNYPTDKASFSIATTVPNGYTALGTGELVSTTPAPGGRTTWRWREDDPTATYLATGTVGRFDFDHSRTLFDRTGDVTLPIYTAIDGNAPAKSVRGARAALDHIPEMTNFVSHRFGPYPFDSIGAVADWVPAVGYALENQTKPHFAGDGKGLDVPLVDLEHEITHQWAGDSVSARTWQQIWFNEGLSTFSEVLWDAKANGGDQSPREFFRNVLRSDPKHFALAPADLGSPDNLFDPWAVYNRPGAMFEGYRQIVGNKRFFRFVRGVIADHAYATIGEHQVIRAAKDASGLRHGGRKRLGRYFHQWLHREGVPRLTPRDFR